MKYDQQHIQNQILRNNRYVTKIKINKSCVDIFI